MTEHERQVLRFIYGRGLVFSIQPERVSESIRMLLENGLIERGRDPDEDAGSNVYRITSWGRVVLGVDELAVQ
ncbi:hypothetical protein O4H53_24500 [Sulfitobacter sp. G21635-S1]|uniref:hypothetical protein n=1 Tax=Sulfitobacter sp. G21635-S1 TaxID=3014043 RepID=UPI0022AF7A9F|nr:hypothetical protein [Sulfitobacter sp. G21635-S1]MCZ4258715.1 hypothetical protein [Sulfitobacter sp. G21635-S1]